MGPLKNVKHELACHYLIRGYTQTDAHEAAGFRRNKGNASVFFARDDIKERVQELLETISQQTTVDVSMICQQLDHDRALAHMNGQAGAAVAASMGKAKLFGLITEKVQPVPPPAFDETAEQRARRDVEEAFRAPSNGSAGPPVIN